MGNVLHEENMLHNMNDDEKESNDYYSYKIRANATSEFASGKPSSIVQKKDINFEILRGNGKVILEITRQKYK